LSCFGLRQYSMICTLWSPHSPPRDFQGRGSSLGIISDERAVLPVLEQSQKSVLEADLSGLSRTCKRLSSNSDSYCSFAYSAFAATRIGISGSASFQAVRKS
jgi:hypothetical protein